MAAAPKEPRFTIDQLCGMFGMSRPHLHTWIRTGIIAGCEGGGHGCVLLFNLREVLILDVCMSFWRESERTESGLASRKTLRTIASFLRSKTLEQICTEIVKGREWLVYLPGSQPKLMDEKRTLVFNTSGRMEFVAAINLRQRMESYMQYPGGDK